MEHAILSDMSETLHIATYNIHKGFSQFNQRMVLHALKDQLHLIRPDLVFLQEVHGEHVGHAARHAGWPEEPQYEFLADELWQDFAYGKNAVYPEGHHGNACCRATPSLPGKISIFPRICWRAVACCIVKLKFPVGTKSCIA